MALQSSGRISTRSRRRAVAAAGAASLDIDYSFGPGRVLRSSSSRVDPPPRVPRPRPPLTVAPCRPRAPTPVPTVPIPYDRDRAATLSAPLLRPSTPSGHPSAPTDDFDALALLPKYTSAISLCVIPTLTGRGSKTLSLRVTPPFKTLLSAGKEPCPPNLSLVFPRTNAPHSRRFRISLIEAASILPTRELFSSSVTQPRPPTAYGGWDAWLAFCLASQFVLMCRYSCVRG